MQEAIPHSRRTLPSIPVGHPQYKWTSGADVQATWRRFGWVAPSTFRTKFYEEPVRQATPLRVLRKAG